MDVVTVVASVVLGAVFLVAGAAKVAGRELWESQARGLGAPRPVIIILPWIEIVIGAALIVQLATPLAEMAAAIVLILFTIVIGVNLLRGRRPPCACFGAWSTEPLGVRHIVRNVGLIALAALALL